jgi:hypothetical protein
MVRFTMTLTTESKSGLFFIALVLFLYSIISIITDNKTTGNKAPQELDDTTASHMENK